MSATTTQQNRAATKSGAPRLPPLGVDVRMRAEERLERADLVPPREQLRAGVAEEAPDVGAREGEAGDALGEQHGCGDLEVRPLGGIVARPHGADALRAREVRPRQHEWALFVARSVACQVPHLRRVVEVHAIPTDMGARVVEWLGGWVRWKDQEARGEGWVGARSQG